MSRKYMLDRWCVRCHREEPTPFVRKLFKVSLTLKMNALDLGCGNGRNTNYLRSRGWEVLGVDMNADFEGCIQHTLGTSPLPVFSNTVHCVLLTYCLMFLTPEERKYLYNEVLRVLTPTGFVVVELYPAKDSETPDKKSLVALAREVQRALTGRADFTLNPAHFTVGLCQEQS